MKTFISSIVFLCTLSFFTSCSEGELDPVVENDIESILSNANKVGAPVLAELQGNNDGDAVVSYRSECHEFVKAKGLGTLAYGCGYAPNVRFSLTVRNESSGSGLIQQGPDKIWFKVTNAQGSYETRTKELRSSLSQTPPKFVAGGGYVTRINNQRFSAGEIPMEFRGGDYPHFGYYFGNTGSAALSSFATSGNCGSLLSSGRMSITIRDLECAGDILQEDD